MHVWFSYQNELPTLIGTFRNKPYPKPWPKSPAANLPVSLGLVADGPALMGGQSASPNPTSRVFETFSASQNL